MSKERFEWLYNETMLKHYMIDNQNNIQLGYEAIVNLLNQQHKTIADLKQQLSLTEKALELACVVISKAMCPNGNWETLKIDFANAYKEQAKEMK